MKQLAEVQDPYIGMLLNDRYKIIKKLGAGGMGAVYLAEHVMIERRVAIKILSQDFASKPDLVQRFIQEARAAARIGHENIVEVHDFGETASGSVFFTMEFLEGHDLAHAIQEAGSLPIPRIRHIMGQLCRALAAAHAKGIVHRDLKPENIYLVDKEGKSDFVKILDFGIAKMTTMEAGNAKPGGGAGTGNRLTQSGMIFGTAEYMSPEQARGETPDHRVDIYALGCILYEMLTGKVPFHAETYMGTLTKHMFEAPEPPSRRNRNIPTDIEAICLRAMDKDRARRFQSMTEFAQAIDGELAVTPPPPAQDPSMSMRSAGFPPSVIPQGMGMG
ncbi:MAG TPA: serine/threonine-protein kinase, partial [Pseudomonadota bacterium]|nr:serine/threonine-protein kinase [Pseudomonadota bacterium]